MGRGCVLLAQWLLGFEFPPALGVIIATVLGIFAFEEFMLGPPWKRGKL